MGLRRAVRRLRVPEIVRANREAKGLEKAGGLLIDEAKRKGRPSGPGIIPLLRVLDRSLADARENREARSGGIQGAARKLLAGRKARERLRRKQSRRARP